MTRLEALRALYDGIKAGTAGWYDLPEMCEAVWGETVSYDETVRAACRSQSVDAALAFIAATLPELRGLTFFEASDGGYGCHFRNTDTEFADNPATALLLAGLAALIQEEEGK